jgi:anti-sigma factor RsiW
VAGCLCHRAYRHARDPPCAGRDTITALLRTLDLTGPNWHKEYCLYTHRRWSSRTLFDVLLTEALDGTLTGAQLQIFEAHRTKCPNCAPMYAAAEAGLHWLKELHNEDVQPPARLMQNILRATSWADLPQKEAQRSWWQRLRELPGLKPVLGTVLQPRFAMTFAMAFCSTGQTKEAHNYVLQVLKFNPDLPNAKRLLHGLNADPPTCKPLR